MSDANKVLIVLPPLIIKPVDQLMRQSIPDHFSLSSKPLRDLDLCEVGLEELIPRIDLFDEQPIFNCFFFRAIFTGTLPDHDWAAMNFNAAFGPSNASLSLQNKNVLIRSSSSRGGY